MLCFWCLQGFEDRKTIVTTKMDQVLFLIWDILNVEKTDKCILNVSINMIYVS